MRRTSRVTTGILVAALIGVATLLSPTAASAQEPVETVALFDADALETPESIAIDNHNNKYISLALTGEIRKIAPDGSQSTFAELPLGAPPLTFCGAFFAGLTGITLDAHDNLYANLASCDPDSRGVWKLPREGDPARIAALPLEALPNGIVHHRGEVYAADSALGVIWRVSDEGGTAEVWANGEELAVEGVGLPGPNGLKLFEGELYVSNPSQSTIVAIEVAPDGSAGAARIHASGVFCDDFAYGSVQTLLTAVDGLDGPTAAAFGHQGDRFGLYVTNAAFPFFPEPPPRRPSMMRVSLDVPGSLP